MLGVINKQGSFGIEGLGFLQLLPECPRFFRGTEFMRGVELVQEWREHQFFQFNLKSGWVCIGNEDRFAMTGA